jgi:hypothetical protein
MTKGQLQEHAIYSLALTPHQYTARRIPDKPEYRAAGLSWILIPEWSDNSLLAGPVLFVDVEGRILRGEGKTAATVMDLDFTGRYKHAQQDNV